MKRWIAGGLAVALLTLGSASAEARGGFHGHGGYRPHYGSHVSFGFGCWPSYRSHYASVGYWNRGWSVGLSWWPSYRTYYAPTYPSVYTYAYTQPTTVVTYPGVVATPTPSTSYPVPAPPQPQAVYGWYHPTYGFWCQCHGYQKQAVPQHTYQYDTTKD